MERGVGGCCMGDGVPRIDLDSIPDFRREELAKGAIALTKQVFSTPGAEERYQQWLRERNRKKQAVECNVPKKEI